MKERSETKNELLNQVKMVANMNSKIVRKEVRKDYQTKKNGILIR
jgi:hypothetical protein